jgi:hypothetical protein
MEADVERDRVRQQKRVVGERQGCSSEKQLRKMQRGRENRTWVSSICYGKEGASLSVSDVDRYVITRKLLDYTSLNDILHLLWEQKCVIVS